MLAACALQHISRSTAGCAALQDLHAALVPKQQTNNSRRIIHYTTLTCTALFAANAAALLLPVYLQASFVGAVAMADLVKSTLGPKGMVSGKPRCC